MLRRVKDPMWGQTLHATRLGQHMLVVNVTLQAQPPFEAATIQVHTTASRKKKPPV